MIFKSRTATFGLVLMITLSMTACNETKAEMSNTGGQTAAQSREENEANSIFVPDNESERETVTAGSEGVFIPSNPLEDKTPVVSDVNWITVSPYLSTYRDAPLIYVPPFTGNPGKLFDYSGNMLGEYETRPFENDFSEGLACVRKDEKCGFIDTQGRVVIPLEYSSAGSFSEGLAVVVKDGKCGFIDTKGQIVIPLEYDEARTFSEGLACVGRNKKYGFIDTKGQVVIPLEYSSAHSFNEYCRKGFAHVEKESGDWVYLDTNGLEYCYDGEPEFSEGLACVSRNGKYGFIDTKGQVVIPLEYEFALGFSEEGLAIVAKDGKYGFIDTKGQVVIPLEYSYAGSFSEGLALVAKDGKCGYIDTKGQVVIPLVYMSAGSYFSEGLSCVSINGKYGFIDTKGQVVIPLEYSYAGSFSEGLALVEKDGKYGFIDTKGQVVIPLEYDSFYGDRYTSEYFKDGLTRVCKDEKYGYIDIKGQIILPVEYDECRISENGELIFVREGERWGFCTITWH